MANNAKFKIDIYGDTANFEKSLKGVNSAMSSLKKEAGGLRNDLKLDPSNTQKMAQLQKNYAQQLSLTREKASQLKSEINNLDKSTPDGQKKFIKLSRDLQDAELKAGYLEKDIKTLDTSISSGKFSAKLKVDDSEVPSKVNSFKNSISSIREVTVGALREIGALAVNKLSDALGDWVSGAVDTQNAMIALKNTMNFSGNVKEYDSLSKRMQKLATDTNANTEDTLKLATTFIGLGNNSETAGQKVENLVKANQAFGGSTENLKGVTQAYQQMSAAGKVSAENINQLTDNNTALGSALKTTVMEMNPQLKQFGSFAQASEKGKISVEMLDKAMQKLGQAGGGGVATIENSMASLNETISLAILPALTAITPPLTDFIDSIASGVPKAIEWFTQLWESFQASNVFTFWNEAVDNFKKIVSEISTEVSNLLTSFGYIPNSTSYSGSAIDSITVIFESLMKTLKNVTKGVLDFIDWFKKGGTDVDAFKTVIIALGAVFAALKIAGVVISISKAFTTLKTAIGVVKSATLAMNSALLANPFVAIAVAIAVVVSALVYFFTQTETGRALLAKFVAWIQNLGAQLLTFFSGIGTWFSNLWTTISTGVSTFISGIVTWFNNLITSVVTIFNTIVAGFVSFINKIIAFFQPLITFVLALVDLFSAIWGLIFIVITGVANKVWQFLVSIFTSIKNFISGVFAGIASFAQIAFNKILAFFAPIGAFFSGIFNSVKSVVSTVFSAIGNFASNSWNKIKSAFSAVGSWFGSIFNGAKSAVSNVFSALGGFASNAWNSIKNVFNGVSSWFSGAFDGVKSAITKPFDEALSFVQGITDKVKGVANKVKGFFGGSSTSIIGEFHTPENLGTMVRNSSYATNTTITNHFNIKGQNGDMTSLARAIKREFDLGRA